MNQNEVSQRRSRIKAFALLTLMFSMFLVPYFYVIYIYKTGEIPTAKTTETGVFFDPFIEMSGHHFQKYDGGQWDTSALKDKWAIMNFTGANCDQLCLERIFNTQQAIVALERYKGRIDQIVLIDPTQPENEDLKIIIHLKKYVHSLVNDSLPEVINEQVQSKNGLAGYIVVVDPDARLLLWYKPEQPLQHVLKDIKKLLASSEAGYHSPEKQLTSEGESDGARDE